MNQDIYFTVLDCMVQSKKCLEVGKSRLSEDHFHSQEQKKLFSLILEASEIFEEVNFTAIQNTNLTKGTYEKIPVSVLTEIGTSAGPADIYNFESLIDVILKFKKRNDTMDLLYQNSQIIQNKPDDVDLILDKIVNDAKNIIDSNTIRPNKPIDLKESKQRVIEARNTTGLKFKTGIPSIDKKTRGGIRKNSLWSIGGRPGAGKTTFALNLGLRMDCQVRYISLETPEAEINNREISVLSRMHKEFSDMSEQEIHDGYFLLEQKENYRTYAASGKDDLWIEKTIRDEVMTHPDEFILFIIDYLQVIKFSQKMNSLRENYNAVLSRLDTLKKIYPISIILLSQIDRDVDSRRPRLSDFKETAKVEEDSDLSMFLWKRIDMPAYAPDGTEVSCIEGCILKSRICGTTHDGEILWDFNPQTMNFYEHV